MSGGGGWLRRNWWAAVAVLPLLAGVFLVSPDDTYDTLRNAERRDAVGPDGEGWVGYAGIRLRLAGFGEAELYEPGTSEPFALAPGLTAWQATLTITVHPDPEAYVACDFELEDEAGRRFGDSPNVLSDAAGPDGLRFYSPECTTLTDEESESDDDGTFETMALFALPSSARPVALWVANFEELPAYARFEVG